MIHYICISMKYPDNKQVIVFRNEVQLASVFSENLYIHNHRFV